MEENLMYLNKQILTYIGNKRLLLPYIEKEILKIQSELKKDKTVNADFFSGSGIVARMLKQHSSKLYVNDLEQYSYIINECYLTNKSSFNEEKYNHYFNSINKKLINKEYIEGIITKNYAPKSEMISEDDRVFYTRENAMIIDTIRNEIDSVEELMKPFFLAPLLNMASVHVNTAGIFKGFYKDSRTKIGKFGGTNENALSRIIKKIELVKPVFSNFECDIKISCLDAIESAKQLKGLDIAYLDPPYNQHPYGSNYFMLNVICNNKINAKMSKVSGIPNDWNRSSYNKKHEISNELEELIRNIDSKYLILSYNSDGFLSLNDIKAILNKYGELRVKKIKYNTYKGSRNLNKRKKYVQEYLFVLKKDK
ncbi:adenine-specific DNA-methyltransferase [Bacilli bacterium PM5-3]|nr:adenine-specific DNA-methyltransferase [Bacilli bacterium PM5-3]